MLWRWRDMSCLRATGRSSSPMKFDDFLAIFWWFGAILRKFHFGKFLNFSDFQKF